MAYLRGVRPRQLVVAAGAVAAALGIHLALAPVLGAGAPFLLFVGAVVVSAWAGGLATGLAATAASAALAVACFAPRPAALLAFLLEGGLVSGLCAQLLRRAERARQQAEARFGWLTRSNGVGVAVGGRVRVTEANDRFLRTVGYTQDDLAAGRVQWPAMTPPEYAPLDERVVGELLAQGFCTPFEKEYVRPDGSRVPVLIGAALRAREPFTWVAFVVDLTERRGLEDGLRDRQERFRRAMQSNVLPIMFWRSGGEITEANDATLALLGATREDVQAGRLNWRGITPPEWAERDERALAELRAVGVCTPFEKEVIRLDGTRLAVLVGCARLDPEAREGVSFALDLTASRRAEAERAELLAAAEAANRAKDAFLATLGHELRNPLAAVRSAIAAARVDDVRRARALDIAERQTDLLTHLVDDLLDLARITQGRMALQREAVDLAVVVRRAVEAARPGLDAARHSLAVSVPDEPVWLDGDTTRLVQVFANLLGNAAKYTPAGGHVAIAARREGAEAVVSVRDDGIGIDAALLPRLFEPFVQGDPALERGEGGLGIGLGLVRSLVGLHGGAVEARSSGPGRGSEFVVRLPALPPAFGGGFRAERVTPRARAGSRARVLVVDDNRDAAESLAMVLEACGYVVQVAFDGPAALAAVRRELPDAVLLDIGLPWMDGHEVARRVRALADGRCPVLIAISGFGLEEDRARSRAAGFDHHLVKPVDPDALDQLLLQTLASTPGLPSA